MSNENNYRAWLKDTKEMVEVEEISYLKKTISYVYDNYATGEQEWFEYSFDDVELLQYTGLKDKNDIEICVGDIINWKEADDVYSIEFGQFGVPNFEDEGYQDYAVGYYLKPQHDLKEIEPFNMTIPLNKEYASRMTIVGNIYMNPEMLEAK